MKASAIYERVTEQIIEALERGEHGSWSAPWHGSAGIPFNATTKRPYRGGNVIALWVEELVHGYPTNEWATFKQWQAKLGEDVQVVNKGERATHLIKWVTPDEQKRKGAKGEDDKTRRMFPSGFAVFNAAQLTDEVREAWGVGEHAVEGDGPEVIEHAAAFFAACGATVRVGAPSYSPSEDVIRLPKLSAFKDAPAYYATSAHEHVHWTGAKARLDRDQSVVFGSQPYAFEELVAELGSAFVAAHLGIETTPREDHVAYLASWIKGLRDDATALYRAASLAQRACDYLIALGDQAESTDQEEAA